MSFHPNFYQLGNLELVEVYDIYDRPVLFSCKNQADTFYLVVLLAEARDSDTWLYVETSLIRLNAIRTGKIDLYTAFIGAETHSVWQVMMPRDASAEVECFARHISTLKQKDLPMPGEFIELEHHTALALPNDLKDLAVRTRREYVRFAFDFMRTFGTEAPVKGIGKIFVSIQDVVHAVASMLNPNSKGIVSKEIPPEHQIAYQAAGAGSFEVEIASYQATDMFDSSLVGQALAELLEIAEIRTDEEQLQKKLSTMKPRVIGRYLEFLRNLQEYVAETRITWATPTGIVRSALLSQFTVDSTILFIEKEQQSDVQRQEFIGTLVGANLENKTFDLRVKTDKKAISIHGEIPNSAMHYIEHAQLSAEYQAVIKITTTLQPMKGKIVEKRELVSLVRL